MQWLNLAAELFIGARCSGCDAPAVRLCKHCVSKLNAKPMLIRRPGHAWPDTWVGATYEAEVARIILAWKDGAASHLTSTLAHSLACVVSKSGLPPSNLIPIPSAPGAVRRRGFEHTVNLAKATSRLLGAQWRTQKLLSHRGAASDQVGLTVAQRFRNAHGRYLAMTGGEAVILVDDVVTTGATLGEAARALRDSGHRVLGAVCLAHTPKQFKF